jgi:hypothetical protein
MGEDLLRNEEAPSWRVASLGFLVLNNVIQCNTSVNYRNDILRRIVVASGFANLLSATIRLFLGRRSWSIRRGTSMTRRATSTTPWGVARVSLLVTFLGITASWGALSRTIGRLSLVAWRCERIVGKSLTTAQNECSLSPRIVLDIAE